MSNKGYYGKFPCDIGTSFPYHRWTNIPKLQFLNSQGCSGTLSLCTEVHLSLRQCNVFQSQYQTLLLHNAALWREGNCNKRLLSRQERGLRRACQYHIWRQPLISKKLAQVCGNPPHGPHCHYISNSGSFLVYSSFSN